MAKINLEASWLEILKDEFEKPYMQNLRVFLDAEQRNGYTLCPPGNQIFKAFWETPFNKVKVVLLGQDPYHGPGQAQGISFSVPDNFPIPPSLGNIFKELHSDLGLPIPLSGNLVEWAKQGVLLLNATLTVRLHCPGSHQNKGWEFFTDKVIEILSTSKKNLVFLLWGNYALKKMDQIDSDKHYIISSPHPSPFSAHRGFLGSRPFSRTNTYLKTQGIDPIYWNLTMG